MDRHVASSKSLETESASHLEECENPKPSLAIERVVSLGTLVCVLRYR